MLILGISPFFFFFFFFFFFWLHGVLVWGTPDLCSGIRNL